MGHDEARKRLLAIARQLEREKQEAIDRQAGAHLIGPLGAAARHCWMAIKEMG